MDRQGYLKMAIDDLSWSERPETKNPEYYRDRAQIYASISMALALEEQITLLGKLASAVSDKEPQP